MSGDEISYSEPEKKPTPEVSDATTQELRDASIRKLEKAQVDHQVRKEAGIDDVPSATESIPKEIPKLVFKVASKIIGCERMQVDDEEARIFAKHLSIIIGSISSKKASILIIVLMTVYKISSCVERIKDMIHGKKPDQPTFIPDQKPTKGDIYGTGV